MSSSSRSLPKQAERRLKPAGRAAQPSRRSNRRQDEYAPLTSGLMSLVIGVAMTLPALLVLISGNLDTQIGKIGNMAEITVYFSNDKGKNSVSKISQHLLAHFGNLEIRNVSAA